MTVSLKQVWITALVFAAVDFLAHSAGLPHRSDTIAMAFALMGLAYWNAAPRKAN